MNDSSLLMIHNAWTFAQGDSQALRKQADDLDKITQASVEAYKAHSNITEEEIKSLMNAETWILPGEALSYGFATATETLETSVASQNAWSKLFEILKAHQEKQKSEEESEEEPEDDEQDTTEETPEDETKDDSEDEQDDDEPDETDSENEAAQKWGGFFNALIK
jgi:ATP-dependent Clp protease protease subunit